MEGGNFKKKTIFLRRNPEYIKFMYEIVDIMHESFAMDFDRSETIGMITNDPCEELDKVYNKHIKSQKKQKVKFKYTDEKGIPIKKPKTAYYLWFENDFIKKCSLEDRKRIVKDGLASKAWKKLSDSEKDKWYKENETLLAEYNSNKKKALKLAIENGKFQEPKPKKPKTAYIYYSISDEYREHIKDMKFTNVGSEKKYAGQKWRELSDKDREKYMELQKDAQTKYKKELVLYNKRIIERKNKLKSIENENDD